LKTEETRIA